MLLIKSIVSKILGLLKASLFLIVDPAERGLCFNSLILSTGSVYTKLFSVWYFRLKVFESDWSVIEISGNPYVVRGLLRRDLRLVLGWSSVLGCEGIMSGLVLFRQ